MFETPILLLVFNRPQTAQKVFDEIRKGKPKYLFIAADGPRHDKPDDKVKCEATRQIIHQIDWDCELKTLFREENRGCGRGPAEAITWFFEHVEQGIILEDDCLPDLSFFSFCEELLTKYKFEERIGMICGTNPLISWQQKKESYIFSKIGFNWGWATWRRAWKNFDYNATLWSTHDGKQEVKSFLNNDEYFNHFSAEFDSYFAEVRRDVWDFQWLFCRFYHKSYSIVPSVNLITNIGFNEDATHTFYEKDLLSDLLKLSINTPLIHPQIKVDKFFDWIIYERFFNPKKRNLIKKIILKVINLFTNENIVFKQ